MKKDILKETREEARKILEKDRTNFAWRSCWNCNSGHEHLKEAGYIINCLECGHWYYKGIDISEKEVAPPKNQK